MMHMKKAFIPAEWPRAVPRLLAPEPERLFASVAHVFEARGEYRRSAPSEPRIGDSIVLLCDAAVRDVAGAFLHVYVAEAGARAIAPFDTPNGDHRGMVEDPLGNFWQIATHRRARARA